MYLAPSYEANTLKTQYPNVKWIVAPHPYFKKPVTPTGAWHTGVYAGTKYPDLAAALVHAYTDREPAKRNYKIMNYMPVRESTTPKPRSPSRPPSPTATGPTGSPTIDLTG